MCYTLFSQNEQTNHYHVTGCYGTIYQVKWKSEVQNCSKILMQWERFHCGRFCKDYFDLTLDAGIVEFRGLMMIRCCLKFYEKITHHFRIYFRFYQTDIGSALSLRYCRIHRLHRNLKGISHCNGKDKEQKYNSLVVINNRNVRMWMKLLTFLWWLTIIQLYYPAMQYLDGNDWRPPSVPMWHRMHLR